MAMKTNLAFLLVVLVQKTLSHGIMVSQKSSVVLLLILYQYFPCDLSMNKNEIYLMIENDHVDNK